MTIALVALAVAVVAAAVLVFNRRRPRPDEGLVSFRKHIDALSPQARREVMDRVRSKSGDDKAKG